MICSIKGMIFFVDIKEPIGRLLHKISEGPETKDVRVEVL